MDSPNLPHQHLIGSLKRTATSSVGTIPEHAHADSGAPNDTPVTSRRYKENQLWSLAMVLLALCGLALFVIAFS
jgi:hypothetical protein